MTELLTHPALLLYLAALIVVCVPLSLGRGLAVVAPLLGLIALWTEPGELTLAFAGVDWQLLRVDALARIFATVFLFAGSVCLLYAWPENSRRIFVAGLAYCGSAVGAVLAGDLLTLFLFWEGTALASLALLIHRHPDYGLSITACLRYFAFQIASGILLLFGIAERVLAGLDLEFTQIGLEAPGGLAILLGFGIKAAFPLLHTWMPDAYPRAGPAGTVLLSAFTTKMAIYALIRGYPGTEELILVGMLMALFPIIFALLETDLRRVLAYSLNSQLGFMVLAVGIGSPLALDGAAAHALSSVLYKSLLFMGLGAVLWRVGSTQTPALGGLSTSMPWTAALTVVGAASIAAMPLFIGFVSKSMILSAAVYKELPFAWLALLIASAAAILHTAIRVPYRTFFAAPAQARPAPVVEAPWPMLAAMSVLALACLLLGLMPGRLYQWLPHLGQAYAPFTADHVVTQLQLVLVTALVYVGLLHLRRLPVAIATRDVDVLLRRGIPRLVRESDAWISRQTAGVVALSGRLLGRTLILIQRASSDQGWIGGTPAIGWMAAALMLAAAIIGWLLV